MPTTASPGIGVDTLRRVLAGYLVLCDATGGAFTLDLHSASKSLGRAYTIKKTDATANVVTVDANGGDLIDGAGTYPLSVQYQSVTLASDGANWWIE